jgi:hypothetical protein
LDCANQFLIDCAVGSNSRASSSGERPGAHQVNHLDLRELVPQEGQSVLVNFRSLFNAHRQRWLVALESGDDLTRLADAIDIGKSPAAAPRT